MKLRNAFLAIPLFFSSLFSAEQVVTPEQVFPQLDGILRQALQQSPTMLRRSLDLEISENDRIQARANLLPNLGGSYRFQEARDDRADQDEVLDVTKTYYDVTLTQPLFYWGERRNNARIGEIYAKIAKQDYREAYRLLAQTLRIDYMYLIVHKAGRDRAIFFSQHSDTMLKQAEERLSKKIISEADIFSSRTAAESAQISKEQAEFTYENAKRSFARLSGQPILSDDSIPDMIAPATYSPEAINSLLAGFLAQKDLPTNEAASLRETIKIQDLTYQNAKTRLRPKFNAVIGANQDEQSYTLNTEQKYQVNSYYVGVSVNWTVFDGFAAGAAKRNALARKRQMEADYRQLTERLGMEAQAQAKTLNFTARTMSIQDRTLASYESTLSLRRDEFKRGVKSETDVSLAQIAVDEARINTFVARLRYYAQIGDFLGLVVEDPVLNNLSTQ